MRSDAFSWLVQINERLNPVIGQLLQTVLSLPCALRKLFADAAPVEATPLDGQADVEQRSAMSASDQS